MPKLAVDPYLRIVGARDAMAIGDCSMIIDNRLPATAQARTDNPATH
jgi:NADH:ubiquinone reductase (non-electrogenic)